MEYIADLNSFEDYLSQYLNYNHFAAEQIVHYLMPDPTRTRYKLIDKAIYVYRHFHTLKWKN